MKEIVEKSRAFKVALMGKTNVGKSSLFNAIIGKNRAIVSAKNHVTRDAIFSYLPLLAYYKTPSADGQVRWRRGGSELSGLKARDNADQVKLMDLAGLFFPGESQQVGVNKLREVYQDFEAQLLIRLHAWISEAHLLLMVFDLYNITHEDMRIVEWLKKNFPNKPLRNIINKFDGANDEAMMGEVFSWKIHDPLWVSAKHHSGLVKLRSYIAREGKAWFAANVESDHSDHSEQASNVEAGSLKNETALESREVSKGLLKQETTPSKDDVAIASLEEGDKKKGDDVEVSKENEQVHEIFCVAILGKPNAGKSSLLNAFVKEQRSLVSSMPGTTRDAIDASVHIGENVVRFIDTAGLRRKAKVHESVESFSVSRAVRALDDSHLAILLVDASEPISDQDKKIAGLADHHEKALLVVFNKWDLVSQSWAKFVDRQLFLFPLLKKFILLPLSVKNGFHFSLLRKKIVELISSSRKSFKTSTLNTIAQRALEKNPPPIVRKSRRPFAIKYVVQLSSFPVKLRIYCARPQALNASYETYLLNTFRKELNLQGLPLRLFFEAPSTKKQLDRGDVLPMTDSVQKISNKNKE